MKLNILERHPETRLHETPLLFVHGAWHDAWCWQQNFFPYFAERGYACYAPDLRGHGKSSARNRLRSLRLDDYVEDVRAVAETLPRPPVVIGHSMGGMVVQKYLETNHAPAAVLLASAPPGGVLGATLRYATKHPLAFLKCNATLSLYPFVETPERAHELLFSSAAPLETTMLCFPHIQDESYFAFLDMLAFGLPDASKVKTPLLVLGARDDQIFTPAEVHATAQTYKTSATIFPNMGHDMLLERDWELVAGHIADWLNERNL